MTAIDIIIKSIKSEEWGDVRSYLDEYDQAIQHNPLERSIIDDELKKQKHLVTFSRDGGSNWSYEEAQEVATK